MKTVLFDIDTQMDFVFPSGALYAPGAERLLPAIARLNQWAESRNIPVISTMDAHAENDPEFRDWPPHCVAGTLGQRKPASTLLDGREIVTSKPGAYTFSARPQYLLEKQRLDCFTNSNLQPLLDALQAERYVVYGVVTELCVRCAAMGLLKIGPHVELVEDAVQALDPPSARRMMDEFTAAGGRLTTADRVLAA